MKIRVLGSAAGGGFPQWNCNCRNCAGLRRGTLRALARTQSSLAVRGDDDAAAWVLVNASPDVRAQLTACPDLQPGRAPRDTAIAAIVLVDAQLDHTTGLLMLREARAPLRVWCTDRVHAQLTDANPVFTVLGHYCGIERRAMSAAGDEFEVERVPGVGWRALAVPAGAPPYAGSRAAQHSGEQVALVMRDTATQRSAVYAPGLGAMTGEVWQAMQAAACVLIDGTFWSDDEMTSQGLSARSALAMGHLPLSGRGGMLEWLERLPSATRRILIHVNNTNPVLDEDSPERATLARAGVEVAWDGLEIEL